MATALDLRDDLDLLTTPELAALLKMSEKTVRKLPDQGLPYVKIGASIRYRPGDVRAFLAKRVHLSKCRSKPKSRPTTNSTAQSKSEAKVVAFGDLQANDL